MNRYMTHSHDQNCYGSLTWITSIKLKLIITYLWQLWYVHLLLCQGQHFLHTYDIHTYIHTHSFQLYSSSVWGLLMQAHPYNWYSCQVCPFDNNFFCLTEFFLISCLYLCSLEGMKQLGAVAGLLKWEGIV